MLEEAAPVRVFVIDDHPVVRDGLTRALGRDPAFSIVGAAATATDALRTVAETHPDVVLVDLNLPDKDGTELLGALREAVPSARLLVLSGYEDELHVSEAMRAGAQGYLLKTSRLDELLAGIRGAALGNSPLSPSVANVLLRSMRRAESESSDALAPLSARERQVFRLLASGLSTRDAATRLDLSPKTVESHRLRIFEKLGAKSVVDLTLLAVRMGLIEA